MTHQDFPGGSDGKESSCNAGNLGSILGLRRSPVEGNGYPLQYSGLEKSMDYIFHGVAKSWTWLRDFHFPLTFYIVLSSDIKHFTDSLKPYSRMLPLCSLPNIWTVVHIHFTLICFHTTLLSFSFFSSNFLEISWTYHTV